MILREMPRWAGLLFIAVVAFIAGVVVAPLTLVPAAFEESGVLDGYARYLNAIVSFEWVAEVGVGGFLLFLGLIAAWASTQAIFLSPIVGRPRVQEQGRSLLPSVIVASVIGALGCALLWVAMVEGVCAFACGDAEEFNGVYGMVVGTAYLTGLGVWILGGFLWFMLLARAGSLRNPAGLDRLVRWLFAGTCVELLLGVVFYLQVRRKTDCYCAMASFWSIVLGAGTLFWMCGPWAVLLVTRRERLQWARGACRQCGYPRRTDADLCPECGARHVPSSARH